MIMWEIEYYSESVMDEILKLPPGIQARYIKLAETMMSYGPSLGMPHTQPRGNGLHELRAGSSEGVGRFFFCMPDDHKIMILHVAGMRPLKLYAGFHNLRLNNEGFLRTRCVPWRNPVGFRRLRIVKRKLPANPVCELEPAKKRMKEALCKYES